MKIFLISDNTDTLMGFRLVGVEGVIVHSEEELKHQIKIAIDSKDIALIMVTEKLFNLCPEWIYDLKFSNRVLIVQIPDRHGSQHSASDIIGEYLEDALGISL